MKTTFKLFSLRGDALLFARSKVEELRDKHPGVDRPIVGGPYKSSDDLWCVVYPELTMPRLNELTATAA